WPPCGGAPRAPKGGRAGDAGRDIDAGDRDRHERAERVKAYGDEIAGEPARAPHSRASLPIMRKISSAASGNPIGKKSSLWRSALPWSGSSRAEPSVIAAKKKTRHRRAGVLTPRKNPAAAKTKAVSRTAFSAAAAMRPILPCIG